MRQAIAANAAPTSPGSLGSPPSDTPSSPSSIANVAATAPSTGGLLDGLGIHLSKDASLALMSAGATLVVPETLESGLQLTATVLQRLGFGEARAFELVHDERVLRNAGLHPEIKL